MSVRDYLGKTVAVTMDRPLGSTHPKYPERIYPVNYGYIPGTTSGDGEELDAYVLGVNEPLETFAGVVRAIIHRINNDDDKLVVTPPHYAPDDTAIRAATHFQEQYFESEIWR
jgi:inorganic pyrophosphatase